MGNSIELATSTTTNKWGWYLLKCVLLAWVLLVICAFYKYGDIYKVITNLGTFGVVGGAIWYAQERLKDESGASKSKRIWHNIFHCIHLGLIGWAMVLNYPVSREKLFATIVSQVKDSMQVQRIRGSATIHFRDCPAIARSLKSYQHRLADSLLIANGIHEKDLPIWRKNIDSLAGDPLPEACLLTGWQQQFLEEVRSLAQRRAVDEVDELMHRFGIAPNARAIGLVDTERMRYGSLRNYLLRTVQGIQPMFIEATPLLIDQFNPISEVTFIVKFNS